MINTSGLSKYFETSPAVLSADIYVQRGEVCGLIGPNGAGKTTLLRMLAGLVLPSRGAIEIDGARLDHEPQRLRSVTGYMPDTFGLYDELTVRHFLEYFACAHKVPRHQIKKRISAVLELTNLVSKTDAQVGSLSRGMRQRLVIAKTLLHSPKVLLLDEPASGLDPRARDELCELIKELARLGTTLIVSSHILHELADFCTSVLIMERGHILRAGRIDQLVLELTNGIPVSVEFLDVEQARTAASGLSHRNEFNDVSQNGNSLSFNFEGDHVQLAELHRDFVTTYKGVTSFYERRLTVEDVFKSVDPDQVS